jgi:hypothetical protein
MCESFIWYYPKLPLDSCASFYPIEKLYKKFGIKEVEWHVGLEGGPQPFIKSPASMANKTFSEALDQNVKWTPELVQELQKMLVESDHTSICAGKGPEQHGPPPPGLKEMQQRRARGPSRGPPPPQGREMDGGDGPMPPRDPELEKMMIINYPKLDHYYEPPRTCDNRENFIE